MIVIVVVVVVVFSLSLSLSLSLSFAVPFEKLLKDEELGQVQYRGQVLQCGEQDVLELGELGRGTFGVVKKVGKEAEEREGESENVMMMMMIKLLRVALATQHGPGARPLEILATSPFTARSSDERARRSSCGWKTRCYYSVPLLCHCLGFNHRFSSSFFLCFLASSFFFSFLLLLFSSFFFFFHLLLIL